MAQAQECGPQGWGPTANDLFGASAPAPTKPAMHTPAKPVDQRVFSNGKMVQPQGSANASMSTMAGSSMGVAQGVVVQNGEHQQDGEQADPAEEEESVAGSLGCAIATMLFSIPALVGSWCWPILVASIFGAAATSAFNTGGARHFFHAVTWGLDLAIFSNITHYLIGKCKNHPVRKHRGHFAKMGPAYLTGIATILVLIDLTRHVINDCWGIWPSDTGTTIWYWMLVSNYTGFVLLFIGVFWGIDFHRKLRFQWRNIKKAREAKANQAREMATVQAPAQPLMSAWA